MADDLNQKPDMGSYGGTMESTDQGDPSGDQSGTAPGLKTTVDPNEFSIITPQSVAAVGNSAPGSGPSIYDRLPSNMIYLGNQIATSVKTNFVQDDDFNKYFQGLNSKDIADDEERKAAQKRMQELAAQQPTFDNSQAQSYINQYLEEARRQIPVAQMPALHQPSAAAGLAALLGGLLDKRNAFAYGAAPFAEGMRQQQIGYQQNQQAYAQAVADHEATLKGYANAADMANRNALAQYGEAGQSIGRQFQGQAQIASEANNRVLSRDRAMSGLEKLQMQSANKINQDTISANWKAYTNGKDIDERHRAWYWIVNNVAGQGDLPEPTQRFAQEIEQLSKAGLNDTRSKQIEILTPYRAQKFQAEIGLDNARAADVAKHTVWMDELNAVTVAKGNAAVQNMQSMIQARANMNSYRWATLAQNGWAKSQSSINAGLRSYSTQINTINGNLRPLEKEMTSTNWGPRDASGRPTNPALASKYDDLKGKIDNYQKQASDLQEGFVQLKNESDGIRQSLQQSGVNPNAKAVPELEDAISTAGTGADCSSFVRGVWQQMGVTLPRSAVAQYNALPKFEGPGKVDVDQLEKGDLLFWDNGKRDPYNTNGKAVSSGGYVNHVGIYMGDGTMVYNPGQQGKQATANVSDFASRYKFQGAARPTPGAGTVGKGGGGKPTGKGTVSVPGVGDVTYKRGG